ncbi:MAG: hypothetical protein M3Y56_10715 [Armatimonadota bacterium]|nr:hypothetical protein [Armatimonadota bacterium]
MNLLLLVSSIVLLGISSGASAVHAASYADEVHKDAPVAWWRFLDGLTTDGAVPKDETGAHPGEYHGSIRLEPGPPGAGGKEWASSPKQERLTAPLWGA